MREAGAALAAAAGSAEASVTDAVAALLAQAELGRAEGLLLSAEEAAKVLSRDEYTPKTPLENIVNISPTAF